MATGASVQINASQYGHGDSITESVLASHQLEGNTKLASATSMVGGGMAWIAQSNGAKTYYRTNTVANGLNENDVNILDFEYWFPVDNMQSGDTLQPELPIPKEFMHLWLLQTPIGIIKCTFQ